ncbi:ferritin-like domain-containing protein [Ilumatobacter sp.]|uniref:ferritin-like domain-containing protein n=1 Tax=Ilumatobacter sp. TaxID=1967498 RepID=UPI003B5284AA
MRFDIDRYLTAVEALDDDDIDYDAFLDDPLDEGSLRCLRYMHDVEHHTTCYLRDLLVTSAHDDPTVTSFLAMWVYEEFWHGEAIAKVLARHAEPAGRPRVAAMRSRVGRDRLRTLGFMAASSVTDHVVTIAMTWGAINEWTTQAGYLRLAETSRHEVLAPLLRRIARQEGRHIDFYASQAEERLSRSAGARLVTRAALRAKWSPVGANVMPAAETEHLIGHLFAGPDGEAIADRVDRRIHRLPGLGGLDLVRGVRTRVCGASTSAPAPDPVLRLVS